MEKKISRKEAANSQINWAIRLIIEYNSYIAAITLAAAAEEVLARDFKDQSAHALLKKQIATELNISEKSASDDHLNFAKNLFKHWPIKEDEVFVDLETSAVQYVLRALTNMIGFDKSIPYEAPRYIEWLKENRPDLIDQNFLSNWNDMLTRINNKI